MPRPEALWTPTGEIPIKDIMRRANGGSPTTTLQFLDKKQGGVDPERILQIMTDHSRLRQEASTTQHEAKIKLDTSSPWIAVFFTGDWHIGSENVDYQLWNKHMEMVANTDNLFMCVIGDERDNFVFAKFITGMFEAVASPQEQAEFVKLHLQRLDQKGKILGRCGGNHDGWTWGNSGQSLEHYWYQQMESPLLRDGGFLHLDVNGAENLYTLYIHHGITMFNSQFNPNHAMKRAFEFQGPYDVGAMGHTHVAEVAHSYRWQDSYAKDYVQLRTGTYKAEDPYARQRSLGRGQPPGSTVLLSTVERHMIPFARLEDATMVMDALNTQVSQAAA